jgi:dTDP-4-amino-4,6-dideoxygalactose transaminase
MSQPATPSVPFGDLHRQTAALGSELTNAINRVVASGWYVLGPEVEAFEAAFAAYCGVKHCIGVASGAEALYLALVGMGVGPGAEVITVANACMYQTAAILQAGARPVFVDIDPISYNLDPNLLAAAITPRTRAIMPVHLYGDLAAMHTIRAIAQQHNLPIIEDAAQAHGAWIADDGVLRRAGAWGDVACFSFYPSKNLGALGDGGALTTNDDQLAERLRRLRFYGWGVKYVTEDLGGRNSRLDTIQAAVLRVKLPHLEAWNSARRERAAWYTELLHGLPLQLPVLTPGHVFHLYVVGTEQRDALGKYLRSNGIGCDVHYPVPTHIQPAYHSLGYGPGSLPVTEAAATRILSLPIYPELTTTEVERVATVIWGFFRG